MARRHNFTLVLPRCTKSTLRPIMKDIPPIMTRASLIASIFLLVLPAAYALNVSIDELTHEVDRGITFTNYAGEHAFTNTDVEIRTIGARLAANDPSLRGRYSVLHVVDTKQESGLDADILSIDEGARVDHVSNVRRIIAGYLKAAYGNTHSDADTLAVFITLYNALYRKNLGFFTGRYKRAVLENLNQDSFGLSTVYSDWPGSSQILIPLSERAEHGILSSLDTTELTEQRVVDDMRKRVDEYIDARKDMTDLKEREVEHLRAVSASETSPERSIGLFRY